jgi:hypothetical protein
MIIAICAPTRIRPNHAERLIRSALDCSDHPDLLEFCFYCDDDDHATKNKLISLQAELPKQLKFVVGPRIIFSDMWNHCYKLAQSDIIMMGSDDIVFRSKSWDTLITTEFDACPDKILFVHGDDLKQGKLLGTHGFLHRRWIETIGYFTPPYFTADYCDTWLTLVADSLDRRLYLPHLIIEHMHVSMKKAEMDDNSRDRVVRSRRDDNRGKFYSENSLNERHQQVEKLKKLLDIKYQITK